MAFETAILERMGRKSSLRPNLRTLSPSSCDHRYLATLDDKNEGTLVELSCSSILRLSGAWLRDYRFVTIG